MFAGTKEFIEQRLKLQPVAQRVMDHPVPRHITWLHCFGGLTFFMFIVQVVTGIMMTFFYVPSPDHATESVAYLQESVPFGAIVRNLHVWGAYAMVLLVFLHMVRVFVHKAYRKPRELNWVLGVFLIVLVLGFGFTGYLLPWDQKAYWATNVGLNIVGTIPFVGEMGANFLRGGPELGALTLTRFYALHVFILPIVLVIGMLLHFAMIRKQGIAEPL